MHRKDFDWLELLLVLAGLALFFQLVQSAWCGLIRVVGVRNWSQLAWYISNVVVLLLLVSIRYGPDIKEAWAERRAAVSARRANEAAKAEWTEKRKRAKEPRERYGSRYRAR